MENSQERGDSTQPGARQRRVLRAVERLKQRAREDRHGWPALLLRMASLYRRGGFLVEARCVLDRLLRRDPLDLRALLEMASVLMESGEAERALPICRSLQQALASFEEPYLIEIRCLESLEDADGISLALKAYLGRFPDRHAARLKLAECQAARGRPSLALEEYGRVLESGYRPAGVHERIGAIHYRAGNLEVALRSLQEAERLAPGKPRVREAIARIHYRLGDYGLARDRAAELVEVSPHSLAARRLLARAAYAAGDFETASVAYETVLETLPHDVQQRREFADSLYFLGEHRDAAAEYRSVLQADPKDGVAHLRLGEILRAGGMLAPAEKYYRAAHQLLPDAALPLERLGELALVGRRYHQAVSYWLRWMMLEPASPRVHAALGRAYRLLGEVVSSRRHLERAEELGDASPDLFYERALLEKSCGRSSLSKDFAQRALTCSPDRRLRPLLEHELRELDREQQDRETRPGDLAQTLSWRKLA